jgi:ABC-type thiamine transport system substrate-binding protein
MFDTLRLAKRLNGHGMDPLQAEDIAEELNDWIKENVVTKADLAIGLSTLENKLIIWQFGIAFGLFCAMTGILYFFK